jgi:hypothetical protein
MNKICRCSEKDTELSLLWHRIHLKISLLIIGIYVTYFVFDGFDDIYVAAFDNFDKKILLAA